MEFFELLDQRKNQIIAMAGQAVMRADLKHYKEVGTEKTEERLQKLYDLTVECVKKRNLVPLTRYVEKIARERYAAGFDLFEVQTAFNVLEENIWKLVLTELKPQQYAEALGLISTVLGAGKDVLAITYVTLASKKPAPSMDLRAWFDSQEKGA